MDELKIDTFDGLDELKIDTFDELDGLLREKRDLAAFRRVNFIYNFKDNDPDICRRARAAHRFLGALPQLQTLQLEDERTATGRLLQRAIPEASFAALKTVIWSSGTCPLNELLPLWGFPVEHIEVSVGEPVARSRKRWPAPNPSQRTLNLHLSTLADSTVAKLLRLSPRLKSLRYDHWCDVKCKWSFYIVVVSTNELRSAMAGLLGLDGSPAASPINPKGARPRPGRLLRKLRGNRLSRHTACQWPAGLAAEIPFSTQAKSPDRDAPRMVAG